MFCLGWLSRRLGNSVAWETDAFFTWDSCWIDFGVVQVFTAPTAALQLQPASLLRPEECLRRPEGLSQQRAGLSRHRQRVSERATLPFKPTWPRQIRLWVYVGALLITACAGEWSSGELFCDILIWIQGFCGTTGAADIQASIQHTLLTFIHQSDWQKLITAGI